MILDASIILAWCEGGGCIIGSPIPGVFADNVSVLSMWTSVHAAREFLWEG
jgi:hypothetical protein